MADTALKFGPEWMRALCDRGPPQATPNSPTPVSIPIAKYKFAEYRYGREEMLALFDQNTHPPDDLSVENPQLFKEDLQMPLGLMPLSEEEQALWAQSVNSDVVLRLSNKDRQQSSTQRTGPPPVSGDRVPDSRRDTRSSRGGPPSGPPGRGAPGRGGASTRSFDFRPPEDESEFDRKENFRSDYKRGVSLTEEHRTERGFREEREDPGKPRSRLDSRSNVDNWRKKSSAPERVSSWRGGSSREDNWKGGSSWRDGRSDDEPRNGRRGHREWDHHDDSALPEWSTDDGGATVGSFDASGAFRSGSPDCALEDEDDGEGEWQSVRHSRTKRNSERDSQRDLPDKHHERHRDYRDDHHHNNRDRESPDHHRHLTHSHDDRHERPTSNATDDKLSQGQKDKGLPDHKHSPNNDKQDRKVSGNDSSDVEDDHFISIEKLTEHMVMKWTEEEEAKATLEESRQERQSSHSASLLEESRMKDTQIVDASNRWFYIDPQGDVQGPFLPHEMLEWFKAGYFQMDLLLRRNIDETFSQLGQLIKTWDRNPFAPGPEMPPMRAPSTQTSQPFQPPPPTIPSVSPAPQQNDQMRQLLLLQQQHQLQQQQRQRQIQQQQQMMLQQQQIQLQLRTLLEHLKSQKGFSELSQQEQQQILLRQYASIEQKRQQARLQQEAVAAHPQMQNRPPMSGTANSWSTTSIWELSNGGVLTSSALEEMQRQEQERKELEEQQRRHEAELSEAAARKAEEDRQRMLELMKMEEERRIKEERAKKEEEMRRLREEEERRQEEEQRRKVAEEEQRRRYEEMRKLEEMSRMMKEENERRKREEEGKFLMQQLQKQQQELDRQRKQEQQSRMERKGWGEVSNTPTAQLSLAEIQRLQEEKEREERARQAALQKQQMNSLLQQQTMGQKSSGLSGWIQSGPTTVKTFSEIQKEEAEKLSRLQREQEEKERERQPPPNSGIWSNAASQLSWKNSPGQTGPAWGTGKPQNSSSANAGFWETDSVFPPLSNGGNGRPQMPPAFNQKPDSTDGNPKQAGANKAKSKAKSKKVRLT